MPDIVAAPPGVALFVCDMPDYYAVGDLDTVLIYRNVALGSPSAGDVPTAHDIAVGDFIDSVGEFARVHSSFHTHPDNGKVWQCLQYQRPGTELSETRHSELIAPMRVISDRRDKELTRLTLM